jgi:hypothetical protein
MKDSIAIMKEIMAMENAALNPHLFIIFLLMININGIGAKAAVLMTVVCHEFKPIEC